jgi:hypothetical protein
VLTFEREAGGAFRYRGRGTPIGASIGEAGARTG